MLAGMDAFLVVLLVAAMLGVAVVAVAAVALVLGLRGGER
jgi:hypothetical protein